MFGGNLEQTNSINESKLNNIMRILTMLEKTLERFLRRTYYNPSQYPQIVQDIEEVFEGLRSWIQNYRNFACVPGFSLLLGLAIKDLGEMIGQLMAECKPLAGKKEIKKTKNPRADYTLSIH